MHKTVQRLGYRRLAWCALPLGLGAVAVVLLLALVASPARPASAAAPAATSATLVFPGCAPTIQQCINAATPGTTVVISAGTYITSLTISTAVSLTGVNSATVIIQGMFNQRVLTVTSAVSTSVVISGITFARGKALGGTCPSGCGGGVYLDSGTHPLLTNLILLSNTAGFSGGGLYATSLVTLTNVQFISNTAAGNGGGLSGNAALLLNGGLFRANQCTDAGCGGGGAYASSSLVLTGTQFVSNTSQSDGGGLNGQFLIIFADGLFQLNQCLGVNCRGGGLSALSTILLTDTQFLSNTSRSYGGGAYAQGAILSGGLFQANQCLINSLSCAGGGLYSNSTIKINGTTFLSNTAQGGAGGVHAQSTGTFVGGRLERNQCLMTICHGGGAEILNTLTVSGTEFVSNTAQEAGGGLFAQTTVRLTGGLFQGNQCLTVSCTGGGLLASSNLGITGTQFFSNTAAGAGGAVRHDSLVGRVLNALFAGNTAANGGGAMSLNSGGTVTVVFTTLGGGSGVAIDALHGVLVITDSIISGYTTGISNTGATVKEGNNLFFANGTNILGAKTNTGPDVTGADPLFKNPAAGNYHLQNGSPAQNIGVDVGVNTDIDGDPRPTGGGFDAGYDEVFNHAPAAGGAAYNTLEDTVLHVAVPGLLATGSDFDGDPFTALLVSGPTTGTLALSANGAFTYTPPLNFNGVVNFTYALTDGVASSAAALVTVTVTPVNDNPTLTALASLTVTVGNSVGTLAFTVGDVEDAAAVLTMTATSSNQALLADDHIGFSGSGASRNLLLVPAANQAGSTQITLTVHDSQGGTASREFTLTVVGPGGFEVDLPAVIWK